MSSLGWDLKLPEGWYRFGDIDGDPRSIRYERKVRTLIKPGNTSSGKARLITYRVVHNPWLGGWVCEMREWGEVIPMLEGAAFPDPFGAMAALEIELSLT